MGYKRSTIGLLLTGAMLWSGPMQASHWDLHNPTYSLGATFGHLTYQGDAQFNFNNFTAQGTAASTQDFTSSSELYGFLLGADWRYHRVLVGFGMSFEWADADKNHSFVMQVPIDTFHNAQFRYERGMAINLYGRMGYRVTDYAMPYLKVGLHTSRDNMQYVANTVTGLAANALYDLTTTDRINAIMVGAGLEVPAFINSTAFRFEYNYVAPDKVSMSVPASTAPGTSMRVAYSPETHLAKVSWVWNFH